MLRYPPHQYMLDTNILDLFPEDRAAIEKLRSRSDTELVVTHIQRDQVERIRDPQEKMRLSELINKLTISMDTDGDIFGTSRCGAARLGDPQEHAGFVREKIKPARHQEDALCYDDFKRKLCSE